MSIKTFKLASVPLKYIRKTKKLSRKPGIIWWTIYFLEDCTDIKKCDDKNLSKSAFFLNTLKKGEEKRHYTTKHEGHKSKTSNTFYEEQNESSSYRSNVL